MNHLDEKQQEILNSLGISPNDFTPEQIRRFQQEIKKIPNPNNMTSEQALNLINAIGLDMKKIQKNMRRIRAQQRQLDKTPKIGRNEKCPCGSGKKYKKCCIKL